MIGISILGTGAFVPEQVVTNEDYAKFVETSDEWIVTRTGMKERHISKGEPTWLLGTNAGRMAIERAGLEPNDIDMIIVSTVTSDFITPSMACIIQGQLGISDCISLDINVACTAFCFGVDMARRYLITGDVNKVLMISAESLSQITNYEDRASCVLFGDGAGACVIARSEGDSVYSTYQNTDASGGKFLYGKHTRKSNPFSPDTDTTAYDPFPIEWNDALFMNGREVYKFASRAMPEAVEKACEKAGISVEQISLIIPHQANLRIIEAAVKRLNIPDDKVFTNIHKYGNTSSATCAIGLNECVTAGRIKKGDYVCLVGFGGGLTYGATIFTF